MQKVLIRPIHIESLPSSTHYRWMLQPLLAAGGEWRERKQGRKGYSLLAHPCIRPWYGLYMIIGPWRARYSLILTYNKTQSLQYLRIKINFFFFQGRIPYQWFWRPVWLQGFSGIPLQLPGREYIIFSLEMTIFQNKSRRKLNKAGRWFRAK